MGAFKPFDASEYLENDKTIAEYLAAALEDPNPEVLAAALRDIAAARDMGAKLSALRGAVTIPPETDLTKATGEVWDAESSDAS